MFTRLDRKRTRLADDVYEQILSAILSGEIVPGERLIQETIASQIDVSRTPVREAFLRLEREGVLEAAGRGGFQIREITEKEIQDLYLAREAVEGFAAKLLAGALSQEQAQTIETAVRSEMGLKSLHKDLRLIRYLTVKTTENSTCYCLTKLRRGTQTRQKLRWWHTYARAWTTMSVGFMRSDTEYQTDWQHSGCICLFDGVSMI